MYLPRNFALSDLDQITAFVDAAQSAELVTFDGTRPVSALLTLICHRPESFDGQASRGRLLGHIAIANEQWKTALPGAQALAIVHSPQAYISPGWYEAKARHGRVVPARNSERPST
jgi:transcriptional regulator